MVLAIENEYKGPELEDGKVTLQFMLDLMDFYKKQGKLHRKYAYKVSNTLLRNAVINCVVFLDFIRHKSLFYETTISGRYSDW